jgi:hypothetical protein
LEGRRGGRQGLESRHLESRAYVEARLDLEVSAGWVSPYFRGLWGGDAPLLSTCWRAETLTRGGRHSAAAAAADLTAAAEKANEFRLDTATTRAFQALAAATGGVVRAASPSPPTHPPVCEHTHSERGGAHQCDGNAHHPTANAVEPDVRGEGVERPRTFVWAAAYSRSSYQRLRHAARRLSAAPLDSRGVVVLPQTPVFKAKRGATETPQY